VGTAASEAAEKVRVLLDDPSAFDVSELAGLEATGAEPEAGFVPMVDGLAITDPLQPYAGSMPAELLEWLIGLGAQGAAEVSAIAADPSVVCAGLSPEDDIINPLLRTLAGSLEVYVASGGASADTYLVSCQAPVVYPIGPWAPVGPGVADNNGNCKYERRLRRERVCCWQFAGCTWCSTKVDTSGTQGFPHQIGTCPGYAPGAWCHSTPTCPLPPP
jgi:hypothetical protein